LCVAAKGRQPPALPGFCGTVIAHQRPEPLGRAGGCLRSVVLDGFDHLLAEGTGSVSAV
jgi:hypothetical protein